MRLRVLVTALVAAFVSWPAGAAPVVDAKAQLHELGDGVYAITHDDATDEWPHGNTGVVVTDEGVLVVDATYLPSRAAADIAIIKSITDRPVKYLVYTHWHFDHNNGGIAYKKAFPDIEIISERMTAKYLELNATWWSKMSTAPDSLRRADLEKKAAQAKSGIGEDGKKLSEEGIHLLESIVELRRNELIEMKTLEVVVPTRTFDDELTLTLGGKRIELKHWGKANSPADVTIYLPEQQILFTGDILVQSPLPYVSASWPVQWVEVLRKIEGTPIKSMVPGHGPVMNDHAYTRQVRMFLETVVTRVEAMAREGKTLDQIQTTLSLEETRANFPLWKTGVPQEDWDFNAKSVIERAWRGVRGQG